MRDRLLSEDEYRTLSDKLREASKRPELEPTIAITRLLAFTGCRRGEIISPKWSEIDFENSCLRLSDSKEGASSRPVDLPVIEFLENRQKNNTGEYVFPGNRGAKAFGSFPNQWPKIFANSQLPGFTAHVLRRSFASLAIDLGVTESTIAALVGHSTGSLKSKYIHTLDTVLIMGADTVAGYIQGLLDGIEFKQTAYVSTESPKRLPLIHTKISSRCHCQFERARTC